MILTHWIALIYRMQSRPGRQATIKERVKTLENVRFLRIYFR